MEAGRELDALIAEKLMGWKIVTCGYEGHDVCFWAYPPGSKKACRLREYSTDITAAWEVVGHLASKGIFMRISNVSGCGNWRCATADRITDFCATAPEAICKAALAACGHSIS